jgi:hypothetical protein
MVKLATNLALPASGIVAAALAQLALTTLWAGIQLFRPLLCRSIVILCNRMHMCRFRQRITT